MKEERIPRPLGFTYLAQQMHNTNNEEEKQEIKTKLQNKIIDIYVANGMMLNNKTISLPELATYLNMPLKKLLKRVNRGFQAIGNLFEDGGNKEFARVGIFRAFNWALEGKAIAEAQLRILMASQGDEYKPFISGEVNKAIANNTSAIKPLADLLKLMLDSQSQPNSLLNPVQNNTTNNNLFVTLDAATQMLNNSQNTLLTNPELLALAYQDITQNDEVPEVQAHKQHNLAQTGLRLPKKPEPNASLPKEDKLDRHDGRREASEGFDILDSDDFVV